MNHEKSVSYVSPVTKEARWVCPQCLCLSFAGDGATENYSEITLDWGD